ncbi:hypothetical protein VaNZ11_007468 [Volvox africanus]|uniref:B30.2/SPRY domain-containing protein n=1 Tax=Volvox africanus TaxID=51714 RepID=A0ABQ5S307_9CHLO|nr:hypothetical protein VaNZ11_007468 [Volvox africanus]
METAAVSLAWLQQFVNNHGLSGKKMASAGIVKEIILPATAERQCSYTDMMLAGPDDPRAHVSQGRPFYYVSHTWSRPLVETIQMLTHHFQEQRRWRRGEDGKPLPPLDDKTTFLWIDIFAVDQHKVITGQGDGDGEANGNYGSPLPLVGELRQVVQKSTCALMVLDAEGSILSRFWCLYEAWLAGTSGPEKLRLLSYGIILTDGLQKVLTNIDIDSAVTSLTADRERLLESIKQLSDREGGSEAMSSQLRRALLRAAILQIVNLCGNDDDDDDDGDDARSISPQEVTGVNIAGILLQLYGSLVQAPLVPELLWKTLEDCQQSLGPYHPDTMSSFVVMADFMRHLGRPDVALQLLLHVAESMDHVLGPTHPDKKAVDDHAAQIQIQMGAQRLHALGPGAESTASTRLGMLMQRQQQQGAANEGDNRRRERENADEESFLSRLLCDTEGLQTRYQEDSSNGLPAHWRQLSPWRIGKGVMLLDRCTALFEAYTQGVVFANLPAGANRGDSLCYFEITVTEPPDGRAEVGLGFAPISYPTSRHVGFEARSYGLYSKNGNVYMGNESANTYYGDFKFGAGDVMGAALDLERRVIFFPKNGQAGNPVPRLSISGSLYPAISIVSYGARVSVNFRQNAFVFDVKGYHQQAIPQRSQQAKVDELQQSTNVPEAAAALPSGSRSWEKLGEDVNRAKDHISMAAVSLAWLRRFIIDNRVSERKMTAKDIIQELILPRTAVRQCRYTDVMLEDPKQACHVSRGRLFHFVSHVWNRPFLETFEMLDHHFRPRMWLGEQDEPMPGEDEVFLWLGMFAINQHNTRGQADSQNGDLLHLDEAVLDAVETLMVLDKAGTPLTRIWCLFEAWTAGRKGPGKLRLLSYGILFKHLEEILTKLDVRGAQAGKPEDKERILSAIQSQKGGLERMTRELKEALVSSAAAQVSDVGDIWTAEMDSTRDLMKRVFVRTGQDMFTQADQLYTQILEACKIMLGHRHPATLRSFSNLAAVLARQGQYEEAEKYYELALEGWIRVLGPDFAFTQKCLQSLEGVLSRQRKFEKVKQLKDRYGAQVPLYIQEEEEEQQQQQQAAVPVRQSAFANSHPAPLFSDIEISDGQTNNRVFTCEKRQEVRHGKQPYLTVPLEVDPGYRVDKIVVEVESRDQVRADVGSYVC